MVTLNNYIKRNNIKCMTTKIKGVFIFKMHSSAGGGRGSLYNIIPIRKKGWVVGSVVDKTFSSRESETPTHGCSHPQRDVEPCQKSSTVMVTLLETCVSEVVKPIRRPSSINISPETTWPIKVRFHVDPPWDGGIKGCLNDPGHMQSSTLVHYAFIWENA